ncbi:MAG TPA: D-hexose-6-phosphate mutarotase [Polyangiaceae bacterium]|jgi:glucose-6-phosphate 1-epimerase|nr:D-hexose-6-phosphate mutarotase [Polyangiaceae bacterium]
MTADSKPFSSVPGVELGTTRGLASVRVDTPEASGLVFLQGAHVAEWTPKGHSPVLWLSEKTEYKLGKALRGGVPICFPWFGAHPEHADYPAHGFARTRLFSYGGASIESGGRVALEFSLASDAESKALFPYVFEARLRVVLGAALSLEFSVTNGDEQPFSFEEALHSYFHVSDVREAALAGLQGSTYRDKVRGLAECSESAAELRFSGETDRVYTSAATCTIVDPALARAIRVEKSNSQTTVVWNPWAARAAQMADFRGDAWPTMLCVESANVAGAKVTLAPGHTHTLRVTVSVTSPAASAG